MWNEIGNLAIVLTLCGIAWRVAQIIWQGFQFFVRLEKHMQKVEKKLDVALKMMSQYTGVENPEGDDNG